MNLPLDGITFEKNVSKNCVQGKAYVYQRGLRHYVVFTREEISDMAALDAISQYLAPKEYKANMTNDFPPDEALGRAGADE